MVAVFVQREFDPPLTDADVEEMTRVAGDCFDLHRVEWRHSLLAADGSRLLCHYDAPDAESVRIAHRAARVAFATLWVGEFIAPGASTNNNALIDPGTNLVIERSFDPHEVTLDDGTSPYGQALTATDSTLIVAGDGRRGVELHRCSDPATADRLIADGDADVWACRSVESCLRATV